MKNFKDFIPLLHAKVDPLLYGVYPLSIHTTKGTTLFIAKDKHKKVLVSAGPCVGLVGSEHTIKEIHVVVGELDAANAALLRTLFPFTAPRRVLEKERTFGVGDRLGLATPGHIRVFKEYDAVPILAQQSMRELNLTNRTYQDVLDAATFGVFQEGFKKGYGADGDHLKTADEIKNALDSGYTMITLDCSDYMHNEYEEMDEKELLASYVSSPELEQEYMNKTFTLDNDISIEIDEINFKRMVMTYKDALDAVVEVYTTFFSSGTYDADLEVSIDETPTATTIQEHFFIARELTKRGVDFATLAPRFCGEFQKGVDYIGDVEQFERELILHQAIATHFGYKLSLHSGSDKFLIFEIFGRITKGKFHVKTSGTNYLEAMRLVSMRNPSLYREIHAFALSVFDDVTKYYHVTTDVSRIPALDSLEDDDLVRLFEHNDSRQLIHITYGPLLDEKNEDGSFRFRDRLYQLWTTYENQYSDILFRHIKRHINQLYRNMKG